MVHLVLLFPILTSLFAPKNKKLFVRLAFFELFLFAALRYQFGNDYISYYQHYLTIQQGGNPFRMEVLFTALCRIMPSYYWLVAFISLIYVGALYFLVNRNIDKKYIWSSLALLLINPYVFLIDVSAMRQCLAISIFIVALDFAFNRKIIPYMALIITAAAIHTSAIILIPIYWYVNIKKFNKPAVILVVCLLAVMLINEDLFNNTVGWVLRLLEGRTSWSYSNYFEEGGRNTLRATLLSSISLVYILLNLPHVQGKAFFFAKLWLLAVVLNMLGYRLSMLSRIEMYFNIFSIVAFPLIWHQGRSRRFFKSSLMNTINRILLPVLMVVVLLLRYYSFFTNPLWERFATYHTILELL